MQEERQKDPSDTPSTQPDQIMDERGTVAAGSPDTTAVDDADGPAETRGTRDMDADANLGKDNPNPIPGEPPSEPDSEPPANKPKPRSAFVKISELQETDMITSWLQAFFGESLQRLEPVSPHELNRRANEGNLANRSLPLLQKVR